MAKQTALSICAELVRSEDRDRFLCAMFAPPRHREALFALYAFNLEVARIRESVSENLIGLMRLQWWRDAMVSINQGKTPLHPVAEALAEIVSSYSLKLSHFEQLIDSREADMTDEQPVDMAALLAYAASTSAPLAQLSLDILGVDDKASQTAAQTAAKDVGVAWALTGVLRALPFHAATNRYLVPQDVCRRAGLDAQAFVKPPASKMLREFVSAVSEQATQSLFKAGAYRQDVSRSAIPALLLATIAKNYLATLKRAQYDPFTARVARLNPGGMMKLMVNGFRGSY